jgi:VanZ family protein
MAGGALLEGLQAFTPDRTANLLAAFYGAAGALTAAVLVELFIGAWRRGLWEPELQRVEA